MAGGRKPGLEKTYGYEVKINGSMYFWERTGMIEADRSEAWRKTCQYELKPEGYADGKQLIRRAATSALTFMTFS
jgi:hypothetical protein